MPKCRLLLSTVGLLACTISPVQADFILTLRNAYFDAGINRIVRIDENGNYLGEEVPAAQLAAATLSGPTGLQFDSNGDLLVSATFSNEIARFDDVTGTFLGNFAPTGGDPPVPAFDGPAAMRFNGGSLYVTNLGSAVGGFMGQTVTRLDSATGNFDSNFGTGHNGAAGLLFNGPDVYVSQLTGNSVIRFSTTGTTQQTITDPLIAGATGLAIDPNSGNLLIASVNNHKIVSFNGTTASTYLDLPDQFFPSGIHFLDANTYLVSSTANGTILKYTVGNPVPTVLVDYSDFGYGVNDLLNGIAIGDILRVSPVPEPAAGLMALLATVLSVRVVRRRG